MRPNELLGPRSYAIALIGAILAAAAMRLPALGQRVFHGDEAVHAFKLAELLDSGRYVYDPFEFHGPTLYYFTLPVVAVLGLTDLASLREAPLRLVPALFGIAGVALLPLLRDGIGRGACAAAAWLMALSPLLSYYSRYYVQETLLSVFVLGAIATAWRWRQSGRVGWILAAGFCAGSAHASKETFVIAAGCAAAALLATRLLARLPRDATLGPMAETGAPSGAGGRAMRAPRGWHVLAGIAAAALVSVAWHTGLFTNLTGALDAVRALGHYLERAGGQGAAGPHDQPWHYYVLLLTYWRVGPGPVWSEALTLALAVAGVVAIARARVRSVRIPSGDDADRRSALALWIAAYSTLMLIAYSAIPYKTPWCAVQFMQPLAIVAGIGSARLIARASSMPLRAIAVCGLCAGAAQLARQAWYSNFRFASDRRNPYVYAHPVGDVRDAARWVERVAAVGGDRRVVVQVFHENCWPLPWYLRHTPNVGYWDRPTPMPYADVVVADERFAGELGIAEDREWRVNFYGLRPGERLLVFVRTDLYDAFARSMRSASQPGP